MPKKAKLTLVDRSRLLAFNTAFRTLEKFGFSAPEAGELISVKSRTMFRMLAGERTIDFDKLLSLQTAALTALALQNKVITEQIDLKKVYV